MVKKRLIKKDDPQGLLVNQVNLAGRAQLFFGMILAYNYLIAIMYNTMVTSMLTAPGLPKEIKQLDDLLLPEFKDVK